MCVCVIDSIWDPWHIFSSRCSVLQCVFGKNSKIENSNLHGFKVHRPSIRGTKLRFDVIKATINQCSLLQCMLQSAMQCALQRERRGGVMCVCATQSPCDPWPALVYTSVHIYISNIYLQTT